MAAFSSKNDEAALSIPPEMRDCRQTDCAVGVLSILRLSRKGTSSCDKQGNSEGTLETDCFRRNIPRLPR